MIDSDDIDVSPTAVAPAAATSLFAAAAAAAAAAVASSKSFFPLSIAEAGFVTAEDDWKSECLEDNRAEEREPEVAILKALLLLLLLMLLLLLVLMETLPVGAIRLEECLLFCEDDKAERMCPRSVSGPEWLVNNAVEEEEEAEDVAVVDDDESGED